METKLTALSAKLRIGRVLQEDDKFIILEVAKSLDEKFTLGETNNRFLTLGFIHKTDGPGTAEIWIPWEDADE